MLNLLKYEMKKSKVPMMLVLAVTLILEVLFLIGLLVTDKQQLTGYATVMLTLFAPFSIGQFLVLCIYPQSRVNLHHRLYALYDPK